MGPWEASEANTRAHQPGLFTLLSQADLAWVYDTWGPWVVQVVCCVTPHPYSAPDVAIKGLAFSIMPNPRAPISIAVCVTVMYLPFAEEQPCCCDAMRCALRCVAYVKAAMTLGDLPRAVCFFGRGGGIGRGWEGSKQDSTCSAVSTAEGSAVRLRLQLPWFGRILLGCALPT